MFADWDAADWSRTVHQSCLHSAAGRGPATLTAYLSLPAGLSPCLTVNCLPDLAEGRSAAPS